MDLLGVALFLCLAFHLRAVGHTPTHRGHLRVVARLEVAVVQARLANLQVAERPQRFAEAIEHRVLDVQRRDHAAQRFHAAITPRHDAEVGAPMCRVTVWVSHRSERLQDLDQRLDRPRIARILLLVAVEQHLEVHQARLRPGELDAELVVAAVGELVGRPRHVALEP